MRLLKIIGIALILIILAILVTIKLYIPAGAVILEASGRGRTGNQLFLYSAAYSLAKETGSRLYLLTDKRPNALRYKGEYSLDEFDIPQENIIFKNKLRRFYFDILYGHTEISYQLRKFLDVQFVDEVNYFSIASTKNNRILIIQDWFESPIFFQNYKDELLSQFKFNFTLL